MRTMTEPLSAVATEPPFLTEAVPAVRAQLLNLGMREYKDVWTLQAQLLGARQRGEIDDTLVLVEHPHVVTVGRAARRAGFDTQSALPPTVNMPVFDIERGGEVTYHGPGQLVGYPIFLLRQHERDLHRYLRNLEEALIRR